ncbi:NUDIX hydrolase [Patescibacteria group bacterium]|nr:NUDIX hydrolase [Patescibacteria group bacterium]
MKNTTKQFKHTIVAIDVAIVTIEGNELQVALIQLKNEPFKNYWALPGGMVGSEESIKDAVSRHIKMKAGISKIHLEQLYTFGEVDRDPRGRIVSVGYLALSPVEKLKLKASEEYSNIKLFKVNAIPSKIAYDHKEIIKVAITRLRSKVVYTNIVRYLMPDEFTLTDLQRIYEVILGREFDKRNFRKKMMVIKMITDTKRKTSGGAHRPASLYRFSGKGDYKIDFI